MVRVQAASYPLAQWSPLRSPSRSLVRDGNLRLTRNILDLRTSFMKQQNHIYPLPGPAKTGPGFHRSIAPSWLRAVTLA